MPNYRKAVARKKTAGTYRPDRARRPAKAKGMAVVPSPPEHLTDGARTEWLRLAPRVCEQRTMTQADLRGFEMLCETLSTTTQAQALISKDGLTVGEVGKLRAHPALKTLEAARAAATRLLIEYGLTPRARGHVEPAAENAPAGNPFKDL